MTQPLLIIYKKSFMFRNVFEKFKLKIKIVAIILGKHDARNSVIFHLKTYYRINITSSHAVGARKLYDTCLYCNDYIKITPYYRIIITYGDFVIISYSEIM